MRRFQQIAIWVLITLGILGLLAISLSGLNSSSTTEIRVGFYQKSCPIAESIVRDVVEKEITASARTAAGLLRLQFLDCFVQGCDGSILLRHDNDERFAPGTDGVSGFNVIDDAKSELERVCPGVVSCADIVALAAREAVALSNGPFYPVLTGRRDGLSSSSRNAANLPGPQESLDVIKAKFRKFGLSDQDLVLLTAGAHSIGQTACYYITQGLEIGQTDLNFSQVLRYVCPIGGDVTAKVSLDWDGDTVFDNHILSNIQAGRWVLQSDGALYEDESTRKIVDFYAANNTAFGIDFARSMTKLGNIDVITGFEGEIRKFYYTGNEY